MVITLIGYRGCGKSSVAAPLAERLSFDWIDADVEIERRAGRTIRDLFADDGEPTFRRLERDVLTDLLARDRLVVAAGGGAVLDESNRAAMRGAGPVVWLRASVETLKERIARDASTAQRRPDLTTAGRAAEIASVLAAREPVYRQAATYIVETDGRAIEAIVNEILARLPSLHAEEA